MFDLTLRKYFRGKRGVEFTPDTPSIYSPTHLKNKTGKREKVVE